MTHFLLVCLGGAVGTGARYLLGTWSQRVLGTGFPYGTLIINATGSFLIVVVMSLGLDRAVISAPTRVVLTTGILGGFTTYSAFNYETLRLFTTGAPTLAFLNVVATVAGCLAAGILAIVLMRLIP